MKEDRRSSCPVACTLDLFGDKWTLLVIRDMFVGKQRFDEFLASREGMASNILSDRLARLTEAGVIAQRPNPEHRGRVTYHLTKRGLELRAVLSAVVRWGLKNRPGTSLAGNPLARAPRARKGGTP